MIVDGTHNEENDSVDTDAYLNHNNDDIGADPDDANEDTDGPENVNEDTGAPNDVSKSIDAVTLRMN